MAQENDLVLIHFEDKPLSFARIEEITADIKPDWYHVKLLILQIPVQLVTWILKGDYINGAEFTMGGKKMCITPVEYPKDQEIPSTQDTDKIQKIETEKPSGAEVISFSDFNKK